MKNLLLLLSLFCIFSLHIYGQKNKLNSDFRFGNFSPKAGTVSTHDSKSVPFYSISPEASGSAILDSKVKLAPSDSVRREKIKILFEDAASPQEWTVTIRNGRVFLAEDIVLCTEAEFELKKLEKGGIINGNGYRWPNGKIPYRLSVYHSKYDEILEAIKAHNTQTNLCLVPRTDEIDFVEFREDEEGCFSSVGRQGGRQIINISGCPVGSIIHEICHAAGMWHEQSRNDRDNYVTILFENIETGQEHNFQKFGTSGTNIGSYDYGSIMHYPTMGFSKNGLPTIKVNIPPGTAATKIGQRIGLSAGDISALNQMYPTKSCGAQAQPLISMYTPLKVSPDPLVIGKTFSVTTNFINKGATTFLGCYFLALFNPQKEVVTTIRIDEKNGLPSTYRYNNDLTFQGTLEQNLTPGRYVLGAYYDNNCDGEAILVDDADYPSLIAIDVIANTPLTLSVNPTSLTFSSTTESKDLSITSNTEWTLSESLSWLSVNTTSGNSNKTITVTSQANTSNATRTGTITISGTGVSSKTITVTQDGATTNCASPSNVRLSEKGYSYFFIEWDAAPGITTYSWRYKKSTETTWVTNDNWEGTDIISSLKAPCTDYVFQVRSVCSSSVFGNWSPEISVKTDGCNDPYCYGYGISFGDWIKDIRLADLDNSSTSDFGYANRNTKSAKVELGKTYSINLSAGFSTSSTRGDNYYWQTWIDFNQDNDFEDVGERVLVFNSNKNESSVGVQKSITIPNSVKTGRTRMRIMLSLQGYDSPCDVSANFREIEDYSIDINPGAPLNLSVSPTSLSFSSASESKTITITSNTTWSIAESLSWLSVSPISGSNNGTVNISCTANTSTSSRAGTITVSGSGVADQKITVTQAGVSSACIGPKNIRNTYIEYAAFWVAWDTVPGVKAYNTRMKPTNSTQWQEIRRTYPVAIYWNVPPNTRYEFQIQSVCSNGNSDWSPSFFTTTLGAGDPYCFSYGDSDYGDIDGFKLGTTTFNSPLSQGFGNYTEQSAPVETGKSYDVELSARDWLSNGTKPAYWRIWIDFNRDNDYNDSGELVFESLGNNISKTTGKITIPSNVTAGKTRIRIALDLDAQNGPCSTGGRREVEDYSIEIKAANPTANLSVSPSSLAFTAANESKSFTITSNTAWTITESLSWLRVSATSGSNNSTITVTCDANTTTTTRTGTISISGTGVSTQSISITQAAGSATLSVSPLNLSFGAPGGNQTFSIKSNLAWSVSESLDWLSVNLNSGSNDGQVAITCANNPQITSRTGSITVTAPGVSSQTITVTQSGVAPVVNVSPTTLNFTANGGSQSFNISANTNWTASESQDWLSLSPASGNNNANIAVTCSPNNSTSTRTGVIIISGTAQTVTVTQTGAAPAVCRAPSNLRNQITPDNPTNSISYSWFFVYWDAVSGATGYSARLRPVGSTSWREIKDATTNQVDFRNLQPNTSFEVQVQSFCADGSASAWSSSLTTKTLGEGDPYCASYGDHQFGDINTVLLAGNALGGGFSQGYSFFKDKVYPLEKGRNYRLELVADDWQKSGEKPAYWRIWIDFNQDNDFNDPNELVFEAEGKNTGRVAGDLTLGTNPSTGKTRMRIALDMDGQNGPCSTKGNRDVEDYLVEIRNPGDVWNEVVQTDQSHIIVLPKDVKSDIGSSVLQEGDQIGVFYTEKGLDYCAGKVKWTGNNAAITVYGDDLSSPQKDGFAAQEKFQIRVWQAQTGNEYKLDASYAPLGTYGITNAQGQFVNDGVSVVLSLGQNLPVATQEIPLQVGWNTISAYLAPKSSHLDSILQSIQPSLQLFKNAAGKSFIFSPAINDIGAWNSTEGYRIKMTKPETLRLSGQMIDPSLAVVPIRSGWQIIPYYGQQAVAIETALNSIRDKVVIVKNNAGAVYIPGELAINTIGNLEPGQGYLLKANSDGQLRYSSSGLKPVPDLRNEGMPQHFLLPSNYNTGQNSTLIFPKTLLEKTLELNDEIGVFSPSGYLCGAARFTGNHLAISVWGDDATTAGIQGIQTNEAYTLQVWSNVQQKELPLRSSLSSLTYRENDVVLVQTLQVAISTHTLEEKLIPTSVVLSPNPTDARVQLYFTQNLSGKVNIRILALDGKILQQHDYPQGLFKGQSTALDLSRLPRGMYQVQLRSASGWWTGKVSVMRP